MTNEKRTTMLDCAPVNAVVALSALVACTSTTTDGSGGSDVEVSCATSSYGCRCVGGKIAPTADETPSKTCGAAVVIGGGDVACCAESDANGLTTTCSCDSYVCSGTDTRCNCAWVAGFGSRTFAPSACTSKSSNGSTFAYEGICCDSGDSCTCSARESSTSTQACARGREVKSCAEATRSRTCSGSGATVTTCDDRRYAPPTSGGSSSSSGSTPSCPACGSCERCEVSTGRCVAKISC